MNKKSIMTLLLFITIILCIALTPVSAESPENLTTTDQGSVNGGVYSHAVQPTEFSTQNYSSNKLSASFNITKEERSLDNVESDIIKGNVNKNQKIKNVSSGKLYTMIYTGSTEASKDACVNITLDGDNDGTYEIVLANNTYLGIASENNGNVYRVNENITKVYADYLLTYDISEFIKAETINVNVETAAINSADARIKCIGLVAAYNVEESYETIYYAFNMGHAWTKTSVITNFNFDSERKKGENEVAILTQVSTSSGNAITKYNDNEYPTTGASTATMFSENTWEVSNNTKDENVLNASYGGTSAYGSFKTILATLEIHSYDNILINNVEVTSNSKNLLVYENNNVGVTLSSPVAYTNKFNVTLNIGDEYSESIEVDSIDTNQKTLNYTYIPTTDGTQDVKVIIDYLNGTTTTAYEGILTAYYNGYNGKSWTNGDNFTVQREYEGYINSTIYGNMNYYGSSWKDFNYTINTDEMNITDNDEIIDVLYYQGYNWDAKDVTNTLQIALNNQIISPIAKYSDSKGFANYNYPSGLLVYNITSLFNKGDNVFTYTHVTSDSLSLYGGYVIAITNASTYKKIYITEEADMLSTLTSGFGATNETAISYALFDNIDTKNMENAYVYTITAACDVDKGSLLYFNDEALDSMNIGYDKNPQTAVAKFEINDFIQNDTNTAKMQSLNDYFTIFNAIVEIEYEHELKISDIKVTSNSGNFLANEENNITVEYYYTGSDIENVKLITTIDGTPYNNTIAKLTDGETGTIGIIYTPTTNGSKTVTIDVDYNNGEAVKKLNETVLTAYYNGYMGKTWTNGENITTQRQFFGKNTLIIDQIGSYFSTKWDEKSFTYDAKEKGIINSADIVDVLYYQSYNWNQNLSIILTVNNKPIESIAQYDDTKGFANYNYPSGLIVYDITSAFKANEENTITLSPGEKNSNAIYGGYLVIIYSNNTSITDIIINEGSDLLNPEKSGSGANSSNTIAYSTYDNITPGKDTKLYSIAAAADKTDASIIKVNNKAYNSLGENYNTTSRISIVETDVETLLNGKNIVELQSLDDNLFAMSTILVVTRNPLETTTEISDITGKVGDEINITAIVKSDANITLNEGNVSFLVNDKELLDYDGNVVYAPVNDGIANIKYIIPNTWKNETIKVKAVYNGDTNFNKSISNATTFIYSKLNTTITIEPITGTARDTIIFNAQIIDEEGDKVTSGKAIFKVNGITLKDENDNVIYALVKDGLATISYTAKEVWTRNTTYVEAVYGGNEMYQSTRQQSDDITIEKGTVKLTLEKPNITSKIGEKITLRVKVSDTNGNKIDTGKVVFKLNGVTLKDTTGKPIKINVKDGEALLEYTVPLTYGNKDYTITVVYGSDYFNKAEINGTLTLEKITVTIAPDTISSKSNKTTVIARILDSDGNLIKKDTKVAIKINQKTLDHTTSENGVINTTFDTPIKIGTYPLTIISGENSAYLKGTLDTVLRKTE